MIIVTGATGLLGKGIVENLLSRLPAGAIGVSVRSPDKGAPWVKRGVQVRQGDYNDAGLARSFEGAATLLLVSSARHGAEALRQHANAIRAAKAAGVERIVYTSHMGANPQSHFASMRDHAATEQMLMEAGTAFTSLRNGFYAAAALMFMRGALESGKILAPSDGPVSWTTHADLAEAAALTLTGDLAMTGVTPALTGSEALDLADLAAIASEVSGRTITRITVSDEEYLAMMVAYGMPREQAEFLLGIFVASRAGEFASVEPALALALDRRPVTMRDVVGLWATNEG
ncbi:NAD(P)H-binding protein [Devosia sp. 919]|uniref:NmrA family NAD(P)-binding protein n=1 Tax=Devosia sp. 919 TaxID=2726065 RepID=UPI0015549809